MLALHPVMQGILLMAVCVALLFVMLRITSR
jgi:hypothetical protein